MTVEELDTQMKSKEACLKAKYEAAKAVRAALDAAIQVYETETEDADDLETEILDLVTEES